MGPSLPFNMEMTEYRHGKGKMLNNTAWKDIYVIVKMLLRNWRSRAGIILLTFMLILLNVICPQKPNIRPSMSIPAIALVKKFATLIKTQLIWFRIIVKYRQTKSRSDKLSLRGCLIIPSLGNREGSVEDGGNLREWKL